jgi:secondary thiamine-phosphate synthase enzyme
LIRRGKKQAARGGRAGGDMKSTLMPPSITGVDTLASSMLSVRTSGESFVDITAEVRHFVSACGGRDGTLSLFVRHTSASLTIQENADPDVLSDLTTALQRLAPRGGGWIHDAEGPDDMPAHIRTMLTSVSLQIPVVAGALALGTWQAIYLVEHRTRPHRREIVLQFIGSGTSSPPHP